MAERGIPGTTGAVEQFAMVVVRCRQGGILQLSCSLGFRLAPPATGGARLRPANPATTRRSSFRPSLPGAEVPLLVFTGWFFADLRPAVPFESPSLISKTKKHPLGVPLFWRRERDSNPRYPYEVYTISRTHTVMQRVA